MRVVYLSGMRARIHPLLDRTDPPATVKKGTFTLLLNAEHTEAVAGPVRIQILLFCWFNVVAVGESLVSVDVVPLERHGQREAPFYYNPGREYLSHKKRLC